MLLFASLAMPMASAKNTDPCNGFWYYDEDLGHVVSSSGSAGCTGGDVLPPGARDCPNADGHDEVVQRVRTVTVWQVTC